MALKKYVDEIYQCSRCGYCREMVYPEMGTYKVCPTRETFGFESNTGRGKMNIAAALLEGRLKYSDRLAERIYNGCLLCGNCKAHCPVQVNVMRVTRAMREEIVELGMGPPDPCRKVDSAVREKHNMFGQDPAKRSRWASSFRLPKKGDVVYFAGCYASYVYTETAKATVDILKQAGINVAYLGEGEWCCGIRQLYDGSVSLAKEIARHNVSALRDAGAKQVVTSCASCYHALKTEYSEVIGELPFEVVHIGELIARLIEEGKIELKNGIDKKVTYHDPCHLGRYEGVYDPPRNVIKGIPEISLVEMLRNRESAWCCGGGAMTYTAYPGLAKSIADTRIEEAKDVGAEVIVTGCALCITVLRPSAIKAKMKVYDLPLIVAESMGLKV